MIIYAVVTGDMFNLDLFRRLNQEPVVYVVPSSIQVNLDQKIIQTQFEDLRRQWIIGCQQVKADEYILVSNQVRGPFVPRWADLSWIDICRYPRTTQPYVVKSIDQIPATISSSTEHPYQSIFCEQHPLLDILTVCHDKLDNGLPAKSIAWVYYHQERLLPYLLNYRDRYQIPGITWSIPVDSPCPENEAVNCVAGQSPDRLIESLDQFSPATNYYLVDLNVNLTSGLTNQLQTLAVGIWIAAVKRRHLVVKGFYPDYNLDSMIPLGQVVDLQALNTYVKTNYQIEIHEYHLFPHVQWIPWPRWKITFQDRALVKATSLTDLLASIPTEPHVYIGCPFDSFRLSAIDFNQPKIRGFPKTKHRLLELLLAIKENYQPTVSGEFIAVHYRLEDDILDIIDGDIQSYDKALAPYHGARLYLATGLGKGPNVNNYLIGQLRARFTIIQAKSTGHRELDGLIDLANVRLAKAFIGSKRSSFSAMIGHWFQRQGRPYMII